MRELIEQFDLLYPQYKFLPFSHSCCIDEINNRGTDKFQKLQIDHVQGYFLDSSFLKETTPFYQKAEAHQALRKDCDGILFTEKDGTIQILLCELKSKFAIGEINKAMHQLVGSYMKLQAQLSILKSFRDKTIEIKGLIASFSPETEVLSIIQKRKDIGDIENEFCYALVTKKEYTLNHAESHRLYHPLAVPEFKIHYMGVPEHRQTFAVDGRLFI